MVDSSQKNIIDIKRVYLTLIAYRYSMFSYALLSTCSINEEFSEKYIWICAMYIYFSKVLLTFLYKTKNLHCSV